MLAYRVKKYVGSYIAVLGGADAIVFTGGIGEHSPLIRGLVMEGMEYCGAKFDQKKNEEYSSGVAYLNADDSKVKIIVLPTNEELSIARETKILTAKA
jgi:acetate kinase